LGYPGFPMRKKDGTFDAWVITKNPLQTYRQFRLLLNAG
jgi:hypothetical protein